MNPKLHFFKFIYSQVWIKTSSTTRQVWTKIGAHWMDVNKIQSLLEDNDQIWSLDLVRWQLKLDYLGLVANRVCFFLPLFFFFFLDFFLPLHFFLFFLIYFCILLHSPTLISSSYFFSHLFFLSSLAPLFFQFDILPSNYFFPPFFPFYFPPFSWYVIDIYTEGSNIICMEIFFLHSPPPAPHVNFFFSTSFSLLCVLYFIIIIKLFI